MQQSNIPLIKHIPTFLEYCEVEKGLSPISSKNYHNFLKPFVDWLNKSKLSSLLPHELTPEHIWNYRLFLSRKQDYKRAYLKKTSQSYYLRALRNLLKYLADKDIVTLPSEKIKLPKLTDKDKQIKFLNFDQIEKLLSMPDTSTPEGLRDRTILEVLFSTGMRVSELTSLNLKQFNINNLLAGKIPDFVELNIIGKGGKMRVVYFSKRSLEWLVKYLKVRNDMLPPLFINYYRGADKDSEHRLSARSVESLVRKYTMMAGLPVEATPHTLRHSFATDLLSHGADLRSVQELLGHSNVATTQVYTHITNTGLKNVYKNFHSGAKK